MLMSEIIFGLSLFKLFKPLEMYYIKYYIIHIVNQGNRGAFIPIMIFQNPLKSYVCCVDTIVIYFKTTSWLTLSVIVTYIKKQLVIPQLL
jgi:hypothetical protein